MSAGGIFTDPTWRTVIYLFIVIIAIGALYSIYNTTSKEHFVNFYTENTRFAKAQKYKFWKKLNKAIDYSPEMEKDLKISNAIFSTTTASSSNNNIPKIPFFLSKSPLPGEEKKEEECKLVKEPRYLPERDPITDSGCGWWYMDDPGKNSVGAQGTSKEPYDYRIPNNYPGGRWVWDLKEAQKLEDAKKCKGVKLCDQADIFPKECGFCLSTNVGVPIDQHGRNKYPDDPDLNCTDVIVKPDMCPKIGLDGDLGSISEPVNGKLRKEYLISLALAAGCTKDGVLIKILMSGDPNTYLKGKTEDAELFRIANKNLHTEENIPLSLEFYGEGSCQKGEAIKYYTRLRKAAASGKTASSRAAAEFITRGASFDPCLYSTREKGPFSLFCLERVALENQCQPDGTDFPSETQYKVRDIPKECGKLGRPNDDGTLRLYTEDECSKLGGEYNGNGECINKLGGSFSIQCKKVNDLEAAPTSTKQIYDKMSWGQVNEYFQNLYASMNSSISSVQTSAAKRCLGIEVTPTTAVCDDTVGCEILWYSWNYDYNMPDNKIAKDTFLGRTVQANLPSFSVDTRDGSFNPFNIDTNISFHIRTKYTSKSDSLKKLGIIATDGICLKVDDTAFIKKWIGGAQQSLETKQFVMKEKETKKLDIYWFKENDRATFRPRISHKGGRGDYNDIESSDLSLTVPADYPLARWDFYNENAVERNSVLVSEQNNFGYGQKDGKKCAIFDNTSSSLIIKNNIRGSVFKSFTYKIYVDSLQAYWSRLFSFRMGPTNCDSDYTHGNSTTMEGGLCADGSIWMGLKAERGPFFVWNKTDPSVYKPNKWFHVAFVFDDDMKGSAIYVNNEIITRVRDDDCPSQIFKNTIYNNVAIGLGHYAKECNGQAIYCGIAWAHWFDYTLDIKTIRKDSNTAFSNKDLYSESMNTGWNFTG